MRPKREFYDRRRAAFAAFSTGDIVAISEALRQADQTDPRIAELYRIASIVAARKAEQLPWPDRDSGPEHPQPPVGSRYGGATASTRERP